MRNWLAVLMISMAALLSACATSPDKMNGLQQAQYDYSAAIRWGDFEGAWTLVDPEFKKSQPMSEAQFSRYQQVQVSGYADLASNLSPDKQQAMREIQINVINKHTMAERSVRYTERWRYDAAAKRWWLTSGLPDFWAGK